MLDSRLPFGLAFWVLNDSLLARENILSMHAGNYIIIILNAAVRFFFFLNDILKKERNQTTLPLREAKLHKQSSYVLK